MRDDLTFKRINADLTAVYYSEHEGEREMIGYIRANLDGGYTAQLHPSHTLRIAAAVHLLAVHTAMKGR